MRYDKMKVNYFTVKGKREENEDYILSKEVDNNTSIHIIADGMGGYSNGRLAAETVANFVASFVSDNMDIDSKLKLIKDAIEVANTEIRKLLLRYNAKMGSTIGAALIMDGDAYVFWVGDVKIVQVRDNVIVFESEDHSYVNELKRQGMILSEDQRANIRHIVTRCIQGETGNYEPDIKLLKLSVGDRIIISSDGIFENIGVNDLVNVSISKEYGLEQEKRFHTNNSDNSSMIVIKQGAVME